MTTEPLPPSDLPPVLAGPLLRRLEASRLVLWLVTSRPLSLGLLLTWQDPDRGMVVRELSLDDSRRHCLRIGTHAWLYLIDARLASPLPADTLIHYDLPITEHGQRRLVADWAPHLLYPGERHLSLVRRGRLDHLLHGSCRKPHARASDGLTTVDRLLGDTLQRPAERPALLLLTGDQIYADDVAGPMLRAIHVLIERLGLFGEMLKGTEVVDSTALYAHAATYYRREELLPASPSSAALRERFFGGVKKPIFTTANAHNHLVTFAETMAMYLLAWSPTPWTLIAPDMPLLPAELVERYRAEEPAIQDFVAGLPQVARAFAHLPSLMIFDDHDITDDWNLSASWEETAYEHPLSRRIIGNALLAYLLCQGWGNDPDSVSKLLEPVRALLGTAGEARRLDVLAQDWLINTLLAFEHWGYKLPGHPALIVLDTRTRRWRSERHPGRPSGLMNWEALCELQQDLLDEPSAIIVSPAPMFGVKLIEVVQRLFTWAGFPLLVDAENWMAHRGAAKVMLNIFRHSRTPANYVILSGDVHYSFAYDIRLRHAQSGPHIWQITSSGIRNEFPAELLETFDRLNDRLYAPGSPLNWLTTRRRLHIVPRRPDRNPHGGHLWNGAGIGQVRLDSEGRPVAVSQLNADGSGATRFD